MEIEELINYFVLAILILFIIKLLRGRQQEVLQTFEDHSDAKILLDSLKLDATRLVDSITKKNPDDIGFKQLKDRFKSSEIFEGVPGSTDFTYTENKGDKIVLCLRDPEKDNVIHTKNTVLFPLIHELAHIADVNYDPGHGANFRKYFRLLLDEAIKLGIYQHVDFKVTPVNYCGVTVSNNP